MDSSLAGGLPASAAAMAPRRDRRRAWQDRAGYAHRSLSSAGRRGRGSRPSSPASRRTTRRPSRACGAGCAASRRAARPSSRSSAKSVWCPESGRCRARPGKPTAKGLRCIAVGIARQRREQSQSRCSQWPNVLAGLTVANLKQAGLSSTSVHLSPAISSRRHPVSAHSRTMSSAFGLTPSASNSSSALPRRRTSSRSRNRVRRLSTLSTGAFWTGLLDTISRSMAKVKTADRQRSTRARRPPRP